MNRDELIKNIKDYFMMIDEVNKDITTDDNLFNNGLTSIEFINVIVEFESIYNIVFRDEDIVLKDLSSINKFADKIIFLKELQNDN